VSRRRIAAELFGLALACASLAVPYAAVAQPPPIPPGETLQIDLPTALKLADERNLDVAIYLARVDAASARLAQARLAAVPTARAGTSYDRHEGNIQETSGLVVDVDRVSRFTGVGAAVGIDVADAIFRPLVARQNRVAAIAAADANRHRVLVQVAGAYLRFLQARAESEIVARALARAQDLARLTADYAESGEGLQSDAEMAAVQPLLIEQRAAAASERLAAAEAELARLLHLSPGVGLAPLEAELPRLAIFTGEESVDELAARALDGRPEAEQADALVAAAEDDVNAERYGMFIPNVSLSYSNGNFGGAPGSSVRDSGHRDDLALSLYWELNGFAFGQRARADEKRAQLLEADLQRERLRDSIVAEVREEHARVRSFARQLELTAMAIEHGERAYALNRTRIFDQEGLPLEALSAMQSLATAELAALDALLGYDLAQLRLHTALGNPVDGAL
jgi:outer membrane protein TolC